MSKRLYLPIALTTACACLAVTLSILLHADVSKPSFESALAAIEIGNTHEANTFCRRLSEDKNAKSYVRLLCGAIALREGRTSDAMTFLSQCEPNQDSIRQPLLRYLGETYYQLGQNADALQCFLVLSKEYPQLDVAHKWLAALYYDHGDILQCKMELEKVAEINHSDFSPYYLLAVLASDADDFELALSYFDRTTSRPIPEEHRNDVYCAYAEALHASNRLGDAIDLLDDKGIRTDRSLIIRAECCFQLGQLDRAESLLTSLTIASVSEPRLLILQARIAAQAARFEDVVAFATAARNRSENENDVELLHLLSQAHRRLGNQAEADYYTRTHKDSVEVSTRIVDLTHKASANPLDYQVREELAELNAKLGNSTESQRWKTSSKAARQFLVR